jgi:hypothetical protein
MEIKISEVWVRDTTNKLKFKSEFHLPYTTAYAVSTLRRGALNVYNYSVQIYPLSDSF